MTNDAVRRAARTFFQGMIGVLMLIAIPLLHQMIQSVADGEPATIDLDVWQSIGLAAVAGGVIALIAFLQNMLEDRSGSTGFLIRKG